MLAVKPEMYLSDAQKHSFKQFKVARHLWKLNAPGEPVRLQKEDCAGSFLAKAVDYPENPTSKIGITCWDKCYFSYKLKNTLPGSTEANSVHSPLGPQMEPSSWRMPTDHEKSFESVSHSVVSTPWTVAQQAPLSMEFYRQEYWSGQPFPSLGDRSNPGIKPGSPTLQTDSLPPSQPPGKPKPMSYEQD